MLPISLVAPTGIHSELGEEMTVNLTYLLTSLERDWFAPGPSAAETFCRTRHLVEVDLGQDGRSGFFAHFNLQEGTPPAQTVPRMEGIVT